MIMLENVITTTGIWIWVICMLITLEVVYFRWFIHFFDMYEPKIFSYLMAKIVALIVTIAISVVVYLIVTVILNIWVAVGSWTITAYIILGVLAFIGMNIFIGMKMNGDA